MSDLTPRRPDRLNRSQRVDRAYSVVVVGGVATLVLVAGTVLAIIGVIGATIPVAAFVVMLVCAWIFRRIVR